MSYFFNSNQTGFCQAIEVISKISNLTASYAAGNGGGQQELMMMVSAPIIMFILIALFLCGTFDLRAVLSPNLRLLLSSALALFLPVMSYLFSEAKDAAGAGGAGRQQSMTSDDLSVRARVILTWMLLVELLRKKVDEIRMQGSYSNTLQRAGRVVWLGSLVYFNITSPGRKAVFSVFWILCAVKLLQRIVFTEVEKRSYPDKSWLISSYMAEIMPLREGDIHVQMLQRHFLDVHMAHRDIEDIEAQVEETDDEKTSGVKSDELLKFCRYIVMGEEKMVGEVTADGYKLININIDAHGHYDDEVYSGIITVGKVWRLSLRQTDLEFGDIRRVCLSFALFKLLRRRFEHLPPITAEEAHYCREILLGRGLPDRFGQNLGRGLRLRNNDDQLFKVMADEVKFFSEYYHSVVPVVLASPLFILVNYILVPVVVLILCLIAVAVCGRGDMSHALSSMSADNYALQPGFAKLAICVLVRARHSRAAFLFTLDLLITLLLVIIFFFDEIWEFLTVLISNWFIISMLCSYVAKRRWRESRLINITFRWILWLRRKMSKYTDIRLKQFSLLSNRSGPRLIAALVPGSLYLNIKTVSMTAYLKLEIGKCLAQHPSDSNAPVALRLKQPEPLPRSMPAGYHPFSSFSHNYRHLRYEDLLWEYGSRSVTEVILTWHIATCLVNAEHILERVEENAERRQRINDAAATAMILSRYCTYLVVFHPELLPDRRAKAELVLKQAKEELRNLLGFWGYYLSSPRARAQKLFDSIGPEEDGVEQFPQEDHGVFFEVTEDHGVVHRGIRLAKQLREERSDGRNRWEILSDFWTELLVYVSPPAPASDEELVKGHSDILVEGVELITVLWAFAMHTRMQRALPDASP